MLTMFDVAFSIAPSSINEIYLNINKSNTKDNLNQNNLNYLWYI